MYLERLWCSLKQEEIYRHAYETVAQTKKGIACATSMGNAPTRSLTANPRRRILQTKTAAQSGITRRDSTLKNTKKTVQFFRATSDHLHSFQDTPTFEVRYACLGRLHYERNVFGINQDVV